MGASKAVEKVEEPAVSPREGWVVWYYGAKYPFETRAITLPDWVKAGLTDPNTPQDEQTRPRAGCKHLEWNKANGWKVDATELDFLDESEFARFIEADPGFRILKPDAD